LWLKRKRKSKLSGLGVQSALINWAGFLCELCGSLASFAVKGFDLSRAVPQILNRKGRQEKPQRARRVLNDFELLLIRTAAGSLRGQVGQDSGCLIPVFLPVTANRHLVNHAGGIRVLVDRVVAQAGVFVAYLVHLGAVGGAGDRRRARENERCQT